ncbi:MAG: hypothetical protein ABIR26_13615 [Ramlibacter sp.]
MPRTSITAAACLEVAGLWWALTTAGMVLLVGVLLAVQGLEAQSLQNLRLQITLQEVRERLETELAWGFELAASGVAQTLLEDTLTHDASLLAVEVLGPDGISLFSTDRGSVGERVPDAWLAAMADLSRMPLNDPGHAVWTVAAGHDSTLGLPLHGPFGEVAGHVVATSQRMRPPSARSFLAAATMIWIAFSFAAGVLVWRSLTASRSRSRATALHAAALRLSQARKRMNRALGSLAGMERVEP